ncbi:MAG: hypothetical protein JO333_18185 [Verrucomicrobia bacterium]|nr:hypothetical protein [Verrucomicrobiota bacterium]
MKTETADTRCQQNCPTAGIRNPNIGIWDKPPGDWRVISDLQSRINGQ